MTKFILFGGYIGKAKDGGKAFREELVKGFEEPVRILDCVFARPEEEWEKEYLRYKDFFEKHLAPKKIEVVMARPEAFIEQINTAHALYFHGGSTTLLMETLARCPGWDKELDGKTIAGGSAGANFLAKYCYSLNREGIIEGLGILPIKVLVHYRSDYKPGLDWDKAERTMREHHTELPLYCLREGGYQVIEQ